MITTRSFTIPANDYFIMLFKRWILRGWMWIVALIGILVILVRYNIDFLYVALILLFLVAPLIIMMKYLSYVTIPHNRYVLPEKYLEIDKEKIVTVMKKEENEERETFPIDLFTDGKILRKYYLLIIDEKRLFPIPRNIFDSEVDDNQFRQEVFFKIIRIK
ncbi:hypothetical protein [Coprobacter tertius]|uniref:YcxB-like protein domain-containing protein n=1 Tax=Coprobacter tertius TaxID=2944915 RepID=A0ABT1MEV1_9BACT|nr:hypothetical protein [Coprobacter tertius]MCP9611155.1 hypothetical protein [Coprobacter tertius]